MGDSGGQSATTRFELVARGPSHALISCMLIESGRTHQIRVHASHVGLPLVGDGLYGGEDGVESAHIGRVALHAWRLRIMHPTSAEKLKIVAPLPADMRDCCEQHGIDWRQSEKFGVRS